MSHCWAMAKLSASVAIPPQTVDYFYGRVSRQEAEQYLAAGGACDGLYLLRWCINHANAFGVAVYFQLKSVAHSF